MSFNKVETLTRAYKALESCTTFIRPALPLVNSHLTDFFVNNYWDTLLPPCIRDDLEKMSVAEVKSGLKDFANGNWKNYTTRSASGVENHNLSYENAKTFQELIISTARLQLSELGISTPLTRLRFNGVEIYDESSSPHGENVLKLDKIMSAKKMHEVEEMSDLIKKISKTAVACSGNNADKGKCIEYLVDLGSGKGYLSSYLTLLHKFKVLAVDSSSVNSNGCEKRSAKLEKAWAQLVRRAVERQIYGKCSKRGKHWKSQKPTTPPSGPDAHDNEQFTDSSSLASGRREDDGRESQINEIRGESGESTIGEKSQTKQMRHRNSSPSSAVRLQCSSNNSDDEDTDNKLLKTLTFFVTHDFDLTSSIRENFPTFTASSDSDSAFGLVGLHTCGNLGVASLKLFISNENAKFICNVPCCFHLLDEHNLFYPNKKYHESPSNDSVESLRKPSFPICHKLIDLDDSNRFCLGANARTMSAYSIPKMIATEKGLELHPSIFYRSVLQLLIKKALGNEYEGTRMYDSERRVGKISDKCKNFPEYVRVGFRNLQLDSQPTEAEIEETYQAYDHQGKNRLLKFYLLRSLFSSLVEGIILLDRLAYLLEQDQIAEAHIVELFDASVSPRCHAILALKKT